LLLLYSYVSTLAWRSTAANIVVLPCVWVTMSRLTSPDNGQLVNNVIGASVGSLRPASKEDSNNYLWAMCPWRHHLWGQQQRESQVCACTHTLLHLHCMPGLQHLRWRQNPLQWDNDSSGRVPAVEHVTVWIMYVCLSGIGGTPPTSGT
jgi:hypothetical protein